MFSAVILLAFVIIVMIFSNKSRDLESKWASRETVQTLGLLASIFDSFGDNYPQGALSVFNSSHIDLGSQSVQDEIQLHARRFVELGYNTNWFLDGWNNLLNAKTLAVETNDAEKRIEIRMLLWSNGRNKENEGGAGDDIKLGPVTIWVYAEEKDNMGVESKNSSVGK